jgi:1,4-dihydroxy-2-naphthoate octaprenyltransferase
MVASLARIAHLSRTKDWRLTFIPFILGCVYLWLVWFRTPFSIEAMTLIALSLITAIGFAALGYLINEYFDQEDDARAGKLNRMALAPIHVRIRSADCCCYHGAASMDVVAVKPIFVAPYHRRIELFRLVFTPCFAPEERSVYCKHH